MSYNVLVDKKEMGLILNDAQVFYGLYNISDYGPSMFNYCARLSFDSMFYKHDVVFQSKDMRSTVSLFFFLVISETSQPPATPCFVLRFIFRPSNKN